MVQNRSCLENTFPGEKGGRDVFRYLISSYTEGPMVSATFFTRNRRNTFCPACQHCKLCHCLSFSISSSRYSFMRKFCSLMSVRIRKKKKTQNNSTVKVFLSTIYAPSETWVFIYFSLKILRKKPFFVFFFKAALL